MFEDGQKTWNAQTVEKIVKEKCHEAMETSILDSGTLHFWRTSKLPFGFCAILGIAGDSRRRALTRLVVGMESKLSQVSERYGNVPHERRTCSVDSAEMDDECHLLFCCSQNRDLRELLEQCVKEHGTEWDHGEWNLESWIWHLQKRLVIIYEAEQARRKILGAVATFVERSVKRRYELKLKKKNLPRTLRRPMVR